MQLHFSRDVLTEDGMATIEFLFDTETLQFSKNSSNSSVIFPHQLLNNKEAYKISYEDINNLFHIFEIVFFKNHLSYLKLNLPNQYLLFKKLIIDKLSHNV